MGERPRILVVDDSEMNRSVTARQLDRLGFDADLAMSGAAALDLLCERGYAMILVDRRMPGMDGFEFAALLREREAGVRDHTPIVLMTADLLDDREAARLAHTFDGLLVKPVTLAQMNAILPGRTAPEPAAASPDAAPEGAPFDTAALARLMGDAAPATVARIAAQFCRAFSGVLAALDGAVAARDRAALAAVAHQGKGTASTAAAAVIAAAMAQLQALAPAGGWDEIGGCCARVHAELERAQRFADAQARDRAS